MRVSDPSLSIEEGRLLKEFSTFSIGGPARYLIEVKTVEQLSSLLSDLTQQKIPFLSIGKGSNVLFDDRGFAGCVIVNKISFFQNSDGDISVGAGYSFALLGSKTARSGWSGLEFASGIPASVGGAVYMNAGANGQETADALTEVTFVSEQGEVAVFPKKQLHFSYRTSSFQSMKGVIAAARFHLIPSVEASKREKEIVDYRRRTQPYKEKSAGCLFRNPQGDESAGALIQRCGLKGLRVGGAEVSAVHGNFIINASGQATAFDVLELASLVQEKVREKTGITLEKEVRKIPFSLDRKDEEHARALPS